MKISVSKQFLISLCVFVPLIEPSALAQIGVIHNIYRFFMLMALLGVLLHLFNCRYTYRPSSFLVVSVVFMAELILSTIINGNSLVSVIVYVLPLLIALLYIDTFNDVGIIEPLKALSFYLAVLVYINFITVIVFPNGVYQYYKGDTLYEENYYFLGHNNSAARIIVPAIILAILLDYIQKRRISAKSWILSIVGMATVTITWSNTAMVGVGLILLAMLFFIRDKGEGEKKRWLTNKLLFAVPIILFFVVVVENQLGLASFIIENVFHKDMSLTGRTYLWESALLAITSKPITGYGYGITLNEVVAMSTIPSSCHNYFLDLMFRGGIVQLITQLVLNFMVCSKLKRTDSAIVRTLFAFLISYFVMWQVESFINVGVPLMFILFLLAYKNDMLICVSEDASRYIGVIYDI